MSQRQRQRAEQQRARRTRLVIVAAVVGVIGLGGVLLLPISADTASGAVDISMVEYAFDPQHMQATPGGELRITNDGAIAHSYLIGTLGKGLELQSGDEGTIQLPDDVEPGTYEVICDLPGHVEQGMVGTLEIG